MPTSGVRHSDPPTLFQLTGHEVRWRLIQELVASDRQVRELSALVAQRQSLTSYHLGQLRKGGLVSARRSSADGRDTYYSLDLLACRDALASAGAALHPGLRPQLPEPGRPLGKAVRPPGTPPSRVLFLCTGNSARSQMAQAIIETLAGDGVEAASAGSSPKELHPAAVRVMRARGVDISGRRAKHLDEYAGQRFDRTITLCDRVREVCPDFGDAAVIEHWSMADPAAEAKTRADDAPFVRAADELTTRIGFLLHRLGSTTTTTGPGDDRRHR
jgi:ArsR family transcriptional regulator, arsenate/arsenite/antimonite-responsive transcriptional repressor / arsenate reductase (thioredoxin)